VVYATLKNMDKIGFIGLGRMGRPMAINLFSKDFDVTAWDIRPEVTQALVKVGLKAGVSIAQIAKDCDIVITMLPSSTEVDSVVQGENGVFANARPGTVIMDMSTIDPLATDRFSALAKNHGLSWVDAPVGRLAEHADRGESLFMVGASHEDFSRVRPMMEAMGNSIYHCGDVGTGGRTKLVNNYIAITLCQVNGEALALSQRFGLNLTNTLAVLLGTSANNGQLRMNFPNKVLAGDSSPGFTIDLAHKDLSLVLNAANACKVPMPVGAATLNSFSLARASDNGMLDFSCIADVMCELAQIQKPRVPYGWKPT
jgi:4-hydroxybutyrate dehydrogenase/sulfolactaldehyde 3-reductase